jgi:uncharacterized phage-associated protein
MSKFVIRPINMLSSPVHNEGYSSDQINKLGNTIIYLSGKIKDLNKTKILKVLFLIEEACIKKYGYPFFNIDFQVWQHGPVAKDIFIDLSDDTPSLLGEFIERDPGNPALFIGKKAFNDDEFSDNDMALLDLIVEHAKDKNAARLVDLAHEPNSLWRKSAIKYGVLEKLETGAIRSTNYEIDFNLLFEENEIMSERYSSAKETRQFIRALKS